MKIFIIGMPQSGRTTVARALCEHPDYRYIDASSWVRHTFREPRPDELPQQYSDEYHEWFVERLKLNPKIIIDNVYDSIDAYGQHAQDAYHFVVDRLFSPKDFTSLFDYNKDVVVFLNRSNNTAEYKDYENIGVSVMRDYCFWLSSADLLPRDRWLEYNFSIPGEETDFVKMLGHKNSVFIVRSINRVISHLKEQLGNLKGK